MEDVAAHRVVEKRGIVGGLLVGLGFAAWMDVVG